MTWKDITVKKYYKVLDILKNVDDPVEMNIQLIDTLWDVDSASLPIIELGHYIDQLHFLEKKYEPSLPKKTYVVNGMTFHPIMDPSKVTTAQFIDYQTLLKMENWKLILNCLFIREGEQYGDNDYSDLLYNNLSVTDYCDCLDFFRVLWERFVKATLRSSQRWMRKRRRKSQVSGAE